MNKNMMKFRVFYFILLGGIGCFMPYINVYLEQSIGLTGSQIGLITAISLIVGVCVIPIWGIIGDRTRRYHTLLLVSMGLTLVMLYLYSKQTVYVGVVIFALLLEVSRLGTMPMSDTIMMNYTKEHNENYGSIRGMGSVGYMAGSMAVGFLADKFGLDGPLFTTYMLLLGISIALCLTFPKTNSEAKEEEKPKNGNFVDLIKNKNFLFMLLIVILTQAAADSACNYSGNHLIVTLGGNTSMVSWLTMVQVLPEFFLLMVVSNIIKKTGYKKFCIFSIILMTIRMLVYGTVSNPYIFVCVSIVACFCVAIQTVVALAYIQDSVDASVFGTAITLLNAAISVGKAVEGLVFGYIYQYSSSYMIYIVTAGLALCALALILITDRFKEADERLLANQQ